jgi:hypothetical protein
MGLEGKGYGASSLLLISSSFPLSLLKLLDGRGRKGIYKQIFKHILRLKQNM